MASYVQNNLMNDEEVIYTTRYHPMFLFLMVTLSVLLMPVFGIGLIMLPIVLLRYKTDEFAITNKRVIVKTGIVSRKTLEMNLAKIENIGIDQSIFARILNYGDIQIVGTGGTKGTLKIIEDPMQFRRVAQEQSH